MDTSTPFHENTSCLNINQTPEELNDLYGEKDYYWYLRSPQFAEAFLKPIGQAVAELGPLCLDVGCGEGQLSDYTGWPLAYTGIDGSENAIHRGKEARPHVDLRVGRFEDPWAWRQVYERFDVIVFGGILEVLVKPNHRAGFVAMYIERFKPKYIIIYDLERLDMSFINRIYRLIAETHRTADDSRSGIIIPNKSVKELPEAKLHRKILIYRCLL